MVNIGDIIYSKNNIPAKVIDIYTDTSYSHSKRVLLEFEWGETLNVEIYLAKNYKFGEPNISKNNSKLKSLHKRFDSIQQRCNNINNHSYKNYGLRGIKCCFDNFWMFYSYVKNLDKFNDILENPNSYQIDRIDTNKNYEKGNLRFVTASENQRNRRDNYEYVLIDMYTGNVLYTGILTDINKFIYKYTNCKTNIFDNNGFLKYNIGLKNGFRIRVEYKDKKLQSEYNKKFEQYLNNLAKLKCYNLKNEYNKILCFGTLNKIKDYLKNNYNSRPHLTETNISKNLFLKKNGLYLEFEGEYNKYIMESKIYNLY